MAPKSSAKPHPSKKKEANGRAPPLEERNDVRESEEEEKSSSDEEEESSEEEQEEEVEDRGKKGKTTHISSPKVVPNSLPQLDMSDSETGSDESPSAYKLQPVPKTKRGHDETSDSLHSSKSNKKAKPEGKNNVSVVTATPLVGSVNRVWSDDDEIALLKGLIEFKNLNNGDIGGISYDSVKGKLKVGFSRDQLRTKTGRMKKRFLNAEQKGHDGSDPKFSKAHDAMVFDLSKKIWGGADVKSKSCKNDAGEGVREKSKIDTGKEEKIMKNKRELVLPKSDNEKGILWSKYPFLSSSFDDAVRKFPALELAGHGVSFLKEKFSLIGNSVAEELNEKWKQLVVEETELHYEMLTLLKEQIKLALNQ